MAVVINGSTGIDKVQDGTITSAKIATDAVTADKLKSDAITVGDLPAGTVLQVVEATLTSWTETTSTSYTGSGLSASITPSSSSSKILINMVISGMYHNLSSGSAYGFYKIMRGSSDVTGQNSHYATETGRAAVIGEHDSVPFLILDEPSSTSSTTYELYFKSNNGYRVGFGDTAATSSIVLMEIAG